MAPRCVFTDYTACAMAKAVYEKLDDGTYCGRVPPCKGVLAFGRTLRQCETELRSTLEDWILLGIKLGHPLPKLAGIDLNREPVLESVEAV